ncbi:uncharacterized protein JCM15063_000715 [Sporobolomyces koalae]|uniref:uncharacterized protein n=1 Tax=Sporobolomyces koalae TaxID=500713 RepID=UPI00317554E5
MTPHPSAIALPPASAPTFESTIPPTPSAFPSLSGAPSAAAPPAIPTSTLHYAEATGKVLPPSSVPKGVSQPAPVHPPTSASSPSAEPRERFQSSGGQQRNRDSPYARPGTAPRTSAAGQAKDRKNKKPSSRVPTKPRDPKLEHDSAHDSEARENKRRSIPGMPAALQVPKKTHARRKSEGAPAAFSHPTEPTLPKPGKKKRQALTRTLTPSSSKLSALAPSFEFVPRSATTPNLSAYAQDESSATDSDGSEHDAGETRETESSSSLGAYLDSAFTLSSPASLTTLVDSDDSQERDPAEGLVDEKLAAETVSSAGPQADEFAGQTLTQSESGARPEADQKGFEPIAGAVNESPLADLEWKEKMGWWRDDYDPNLPQVDESGVESEVTEDKKEAEDLALAPAAVEANSNESPLLQFPPWTPQASTEPEETGQVDVSDSTVSPALLSEVLSSSFTESDSTPTATAGESASATDSTNPVAPTPASEPSAPSTPSLSSFLSNSFTPPVKGYSATSSAFDSAFLSVDELKAEKLAQAGPADANQQDALDMPLSAEAVASQPTLDDALDVDAAVRKEGSASRPAVESKEEGRKQWWKDEDDEQNETEKPQPGQAEHSDTMVDEQLAKETVESAGAQADGFVAKGFEEADKIGEDAEAGEKAVQKVAEQKEVSEEGHREVVEEKPEENTTEEEEVPQQGSSTPLGSYLTSAFQPETTSFSSTTAADDSTREESDAPVDKIDASASSVPAVPSPSRRRSSSPSPPRPQPQSSDAHAADSAPSLTLAISSAWHTAPWSRKLWAIIASVAINVGLPFVNGVMLGFGELFARNVLGVRFGWPLHNDTATTGSSSRANTGGVGLRSAGSYKASNNGGHGVGTDVPGHAGAKTALEGVVESIAE